MDRERTACLACGRDTTTTARGACVECWTPKRSEGTSPFAGRRHDRTSLGLADWLEDVPAAAWLAGLATVAGLVLAAVLLG